MKTKILILLISSLAFAKEFSVTLTPAGVHRVLPSSSLIKEEQRMIDKGALFYQKERVPMLKGKIVFNSNIKELPEWVEKKGWHSTFRVASFYKLEKGEWRDVAKNNYQFHIKNKRKYQEKISSIWIVEFDIYIDWLTADEFPAGHYMLTRAQFLDENFKRIKANKNITLAVSAYDNKNKNDITNLHSTLAIESLIQANKKVDEKLYKKTLDNAEKVLSVMPENDRMYITAADAAINLKDYKAAVKYYEKVIALWKQTNSVKYLKGWFHISPLDPPAEYIKEAEKRLIVLKKALK